VEAELAGGWLALGLAEAERAGGGLAGGLAEAEPAGAPLFDEQAPRSREPRSAVRMRRGAMSETSERGLPALRWSGEEMYPAPILHLS
ncbi:MAG: hypothetical protein KGJ86_21675, partial [Chloroflexota bacterium]|nr:hypothetical protein [Chloroflexota bacterium]